MTTTGLDKLAHDRLARNWKELVELQAWFEAGHGKWVYRGLRSDKWALETNLERAVRRFDCKGSPNSKLEFGLLRQFQRRAHHYLTDVPERDNWIEWLALMQHHGAPTRLMDWTYSFYIGLHFAVEHFGLERSDTSCVIWALDLDWVDEQLERILSPKDWKAINGDDWNLENARTFTRIFARPRSNRYSLVCAVNPFRLNQRLSIQQGVFLCQGDISKPFQTNLAAMFLGKKASMKLVKCTISLDDDARIEVARKLIQMNMTRTSLFPGLDGFSSSLALALSNPKVLMPGKAYPRD
jgi:hypothetical protein